MMPPPRAARAIGLGPFLAVSLLSIAAVAAEAPIGFAIPAGVKSVMMIDADPAQPDTTAATLFDVDPDGLPAIADGTALRLFGSSRQLIDLGGPRIEDFAWMRDGALLLVTGGRLAALSPSGIVQSLALPVAGMRIRPAGPDTAYVFGGAAAPVNRDVYLFARTGRIAKLATLPAPVTAVAGDGRTTYVAVERTILRIALDQPPRALVETRDPVVSLEAAADDALFYATRSSVGYLDRAGRATEFIRGDGGPLRTRGSTLFVLLSGGNLLRLGPIDRFATALPPIERETEAKPDDEPVSDSGLLAEIADRLYELNFDPGRRDGGMDEATAAVIREYERTSGRAESGKATYGLLRALRRSGARSPWGAIVYARELGKWGMGWGHESRKAAVASAVASCGDPARCSTEMTFFGTDCGAFAHSGRDWSIAARETHAEARQAALDDCQRRGAKCRLIAAVCADGSNRWETGK